MSSPSQSSNSSVLQEIYKYNPSSVIELYELSLSPLSEYYSSKGTPISTQVYRFHNGYSEKYGTVSPNVQWDGNSYSARPVQMEGLQVSGSGEVARPSFAIANHDLVFTQLNKAYANLVGAKVRRIRTLVKFLDSENFQTRNLLLNTEAINSWTVVNSTVGSNTTATADPLGTFTADKLYENSTTSLIHRVEQTITAANNTNICVSAYLKAAERTSAGIALLNKANVQNVTSFNLSTGAVSSTSSGTIISSGIAPVGNGWYRCWVVASSGSGATNLTARILIDNDFNPASFQYAGTVNSGIYIWGAQAEVVSTVTNTPTTYQQVGATAGNPTADPNAKFPDDVFVIDRMSDETPGQVTYELAPAWDVEGVQLPRRQVVANICPWTYKADPCNWAYSGAVSATFTSGTSSAAAVISATITGTTMTVSTVTSGTIRPGMFLTGGTVLSSTEIVSQLTGTTGSTGTYTVSKSQSATGITGATPVGTHSGVPVKSTTKSGSGALLKIVVATANASYSSATITITNPGKNYSTSAPAEQLTIDGTYLGGASGTHDLVVTLSAVSNTFFDENDLIVSTASQDRCGKRYTSCKLRFGSRALPFGGFPSAGLYGKPI